MKTDGKTFKLVRASVWGLTLWFLAVFSWLQATEETGPHHIAKVIIAVLLSLAVLAKICRITSLTSASQLNSNDTQFEIWTIGRAVAGVLFAGSAFIMLMGINAKTASDMVWIWACTVAGVSLLISVFWTLHDEIKTKALEHR